MPAALERLMQGGPDQARRVAEAMLRTVKFDIAALERAAAG